jgi:hypothetical protein
MNHFTDHLSDDQLTEAYYGHSSFKEHLNLCDPCRTRFNHLREVLDAFNQFPIPHREPTHGAEMWTRVLAQLPPDKPARSDRWRWWLLSPALAALLAIAFITGRITQHNPPAAPVAGISDVARERVLLLSLSDHLEQSQIVLANVANSEPGSQDLPSERDRAHELLGANRLLRQTAVRLGDKTDAALLEELERALLNVANSPDLDQTRRQIQQDGLLFRVRVTSTSTRERGQKL